MAGTLIADRRLWLTADKSRVVEEGDVAAATLLVATGQGLLPADLERFGISVANGKLVLKGKAKLAAKMAPAPEDKSVKKGEKKGA